jgi:plastocyanin
MRALAATYLLAAMLATPAVLWAADDPPAAPAEPAATTPAAPAPTATEPRPAKADASDEPAKTRDLSAPVARATASDSVTIKNFAFSPSTITVNVGDTIKWTNQDSAPHTATAKDGSFDTGNLDKGDSGSHTFSKVGTFAYICSVHPSMKATVVVKSAANDNSGSSGGGGSSSDSSSSNSNPFTPDSSGSAAADTSSSLANTGGDAALVGLVGLLLLGAGALLRRRLSER